MRALKIIFAGLGAIVGLGAIAIGLLWMRTIAMPEPDSVPRDVEVAEAYTGAQQAAEAELETLLAGAVIPGLSAAVSHRGQVVFTFVAGYADLARAQPVTVQSRFLVGSVSKTLTATAALALAESGVLDLDEGVGAYVDGLPPELAAVTTRQLLSHQGGVRHYRAQFNPNAVLVPSEMGDGTVYDSVADSLSVFQDDPLEFEPGADFRYSTFGYTLASAAIEGAAGDDFLSVMQARVFGPAGMTRTMADYDSPVPEGRVTDYLPLFGRALPAPDTSQSGKWAGGGLLSTASDLARFGGALLDARLIHSENLDMMLTQSRLPDGSSPQGYGLGWRVRPPDSAEDGTQNRLIAHHGGTSIGSQAALLIVPRHGLTVAITANAYTGGSGAFIRAADAIARAFEAEISAGLEPGAEAPA